MRASKVPVAVALRVLLPQGQRRATDASPTVSDDEILRGQLPHIAQRRELTVAPLEGRLLPRTNHKMAAVYDQAVRLLAMRGRDYAEAYLRLYPARTDTIMRVLYDRGRRRAA